MDAETGAKKQTFRERVRVFGRQLRQNGLNLIIFSVLTGIVSGAVITLYNIGMTYGEEFAAEFYSIFLERPYFIPLLFVLLIFGAIVIGTLVKMVPMIKGTGIPQIEGAARGEVVFKWYVTLCSMLAASLACSFMGLNCGAEGPSVEIGGCIGDGVGAVLRRSQMTRRLQIAAGSSAGLAIASNAPITGLVFALEEAFHSFSAQVFISAGVSVVFALITRNSIRSLLGMSVGFSLDTFVFTDISLSGLLYVLLAVVVVALAGVGFYYASIGSRKLFRKVTFFSGTGKYIIVFCIFGGFGLISSYAMGGGHSFIDALGTEGTGEYDLVSIFGTGMLVTVLIVVIMKFAGCVMNMGCELPCGVIIPMLATGAGLGAVMAMLMQEMGMDPAYSDFLVIVCMGTFFTTTVRAPITGMVMCFEFTGQFSNALPVLLGITVGYIMGELFRAEPLFDKSLEMYREEEKLDAKSVKRRVRAEVKPMSLADGNRIRDIVWPSNGLVVHIVHPDGLIIVPDGETVLSAGDVIIFECETLEEKSLLKYITSITGDSEDVFERVVSDTADIKDRISPGLSGPPVAGSASPLEDGVPAAPDAPDGDDGACETDAPDVASSGTPAGDASQEDETGKIGPDAG